MRRCEILILAALRMEAQALARALQLRETWPLSYAPGISLAVIGPGATRFPAVIDDIEPCAILLAGLGGGLAPSLRVGAVVVAPPEMPGHICCSRTVLTTPEEKAALFRREGAQAVDMECAPVRAHAAKLGVPCTVIRAISDTAGESLDPAVMGLVDPAGTSRTGAALALLARHPGKLAMLLRLNRASRLALDTLARAVVDFVHVKETAKRRPC